MKMKHDVDWGIPKMGRGKRRGVLNEWRAGAACMARSAGTGSAKYGCDAALDAVSVDYGYRVRT